MVFIEKTEVFGWEAAIRGMRNSFNSWDRSDSKFDEHGNYIVGEADLDLMDKLSRSGPSHAKFLRYINVSFDITAPRYWWAEMDTYKVGTGPNTNATNANLLKYTLCVLAVLDWWINNQESPAYTTSPMHIYRISEEDGKPIFSVPERNDQNKVFAEAIKAAYNKKK